MLSIKRERERKRKNKKLDVQRIYLMNFAFIDNELKNARIKKTPNQNDYSVHGIYLNYIVYT